MFKYLIYGVCAESDFKLYNIPETSGEPEIFIKEGKVDTSLIKEKEDIFYSNDKVVFIGRNEKVAVTDGKYITIEIVNKNVDSETIAATIIGYAFAFLFTQRGGSAIHCTALNMFGKGVIISGVSGSGKSSTAFSLMKKGHKYLADDMAIVKPAETCQLIPAYPIQKICHDQAEGLDEDKLLYISEVRDKYSYLNREDFCDKPVELKALFQILVDDNLDELKIEEAKGVSSYCRVLECLYLSLIYLHFGINEGDRFRCLRLAGLAKVYVITRPKNKNTLDEITSEIEKIMETL